MRYLPVQTYDLKERARIYNTEEHSYPFREIAVIKYEASFQSTALLYRSSSATVLYSGLPSNDGKAVGRFREIAATVAEFIPKKVSYFAVN